MNGMKRKTLMWLVGLALAIALGGAWWTYGEASPEPTVDLVTVEPATSLTIDFDGKQIVLDWSGGKLDVIGDPNDYTEAAALFFEHLVCPCCMARNRLARSE